MNIYECLLTHLLPILRTPSDNSIAHMIKNRSYPYILPLFCSAYLLQLSVPIMALPMSLGKLIHLTVFNFIQYKTNIFISMS